MSEPIIGVAHDPGGARAVLPVLELLHSRNVRVLAVVSGPAIEIAETGFASLPRISMDDSSTLGSCVVELERHGCPVLLSAAGLYNQIEHTVRLAARGLGIPVVAVLDWWRAYRERFERADPRGTIERSWPDRICAIDEASRDGLIEAGFAPETITIAGAVSLESSSRRLERFASERQKIRTELGVCDGVPCAIFFSEPYIRDSDGLPWGGTGGYFKDDGTPVFGYNSSEMLVEVSSALSKKTHGAPDIVLFVKPHPMEHIPSLEETVRECARTGQSVRMIKDADPVKLLAAGDIFFGMASIILVEAGMTGKPVFSVQIGLSSGKTEDPCVANRLGFSTPIGSRDSLEEAIARWRGGERLQAPSVNPDMWNGAAARVAECIFETIGTGFPKNLSGKAHQ